MLFGSVLKLETPNESSVVSEYVPLELRAAPIDPPNSTPIPLPSAKTPVGKGTLPARTRFTSPNARENDWVAPKGTLIGNVTLSEIEVELFCAAIRRDVDNKLPCASVTWASTASDVKYCNSVLGKL